MLRMSATVCSLSPSYRHEQLFHTSEIPEQRENRIWNLRVDDAVVLAPLLNRILFSGLPLFPIGSSADHDHFAEGGV